jgi:Amidohydrolase
VVWASDWPHPTVKEKPNDAVLFDLLAEWAPEAAARTAILVENPATLYGFPKSTSRELEPVTPAGEAGSSGKPLLLGRGTCH